MHILISNARVQEYFIAIIKNFTSLHWFHYYVPLIVLFVAVPSDLNLITHDNSMYGKYDGGWILLTKNSKVSCTTSITSMIYRLIIHIYIYIYNLALYHSMEKYQYLIKYELIQIGKVKELSSNTIFFFLRL